MVSQPMVSWMLAVCLAAYSTPAGVRSLGVIVYAENAAVGEGTASVGTTLYEGDRLTTDEDGELALRSGAMMLKLQAQSSITLRAGDLSGKSTLVELGAGTVIFSTARAGAAEIHAGAAVIVPVNDEPTVAQIRSVDPKELRVFAQRGSLNFSYRGESAEITEGSCYRVLLDPEDHDPAGSAAGGKKAGHAHKSFLLIAIAAGTAGAAIGFSHRHHHESPEMP